MSDLRKIIEYFVKFHPEIANDVYFTLEDIFLNRKPLSEDFEINKPTNPIDSESFLS